MNDSEFSDKITHIVNALFYSGIVFHSFLIIFVNDLQNLLRMIGNNCYNIVVDRLKKYN